MKQLLEHVITLFLGAVLLEGVHVLLSQQISQQDRFFAALLIGNLIVAIVALSATVLMLRGSTQLATDVTQRLNVLGETSRSLSSEVTAQVGLLEHRLGEIAPSFRYYAVERDPADREALFTRTREIIDNARDEILALNAWSEEWRYPGADERFRNGHFTALLNAARRGVSYKRLVQVSDRRRSAGSPLESSRHRAIRLQDDFDSSYIDHFKDMIADQRHPVAPNERIELHILPPRYPSTFLIVDREFLLWQLNTVATNSASGTPGIGSRKRFLMRAVVVVHDVPGDFIEKFRATFDDACRSIERAMTEDDVTSA